MTREDGTTISVQSVAQEALAEQQLIVTRLVYSVLRHGDILQQVERNWSIRWYEHRQLCRMLEKAGFVVQSSHDFDGEISREQSCNFSIVARKPAD